MAVSPLPAEGLAPDLLFERMEECRREDVDWLCATLDRECRRLGTGVSCPHDGSLLLDWT